MTGLENPCREEEESRMQCTMEWEGGRKEGTRGTLEGNRKIGRTIILLFLSVEVSRPHQ